MRLRRAPSEGHPASLRAIRRTIFRKQWEAMGTLYVDGYPAEEIPEALVTARPREMEVRNG